MMSYPESGTPQGGVVSPLLANIYLHEVLDRWFAEVVKPRMEGRAFLVRYADDAVLAFSSRKDARRVMNVLAKRFGKYGLKLHPEKTRMIVFYRPGPQQRRGHGTFEFLGFTHYWGRSRNGRWVVKWKTASERQTRAIRSVAQWCKRHRHWPVKVQHQILVRKLRGHCEYYGITGNSKSLARFKREMERSWQRWLNRRSQRHAMRWDRFRRLLERYPLPPARAVHSVYVIAAKP
jgi:hypothetical protein